MSVNEKYNNNIKKTDDEIMRGKIDRLRRLINDSHHIVAITGVGMEIEAGGHNLRRDEEAYRLEDIYGYTGDEIFSVGFYSTKKDIFFEFYKNEILSDADIHNEGHEALLEIERRGKLKACITSSLEGGCCAAGLKNVIEYRGSIHHNVCPKCGRDYSVQEILNKKGVPLCDQCLIPLRPQAILIGEMVRNDVMTRAASYVQNADMILVLGTNLKNDTVHNLIQYYEGDKLVLITKIPKQGDSKASLLIPGEVCRILPAAVW